MNQRRMLRPVEQSGKWQAGGVGSGYGVRSEDPEADTDAGRVDSRSESGGRGGESVSKSLTKGLADYRARSCLGGCERA